MGRFVLSDTTVHQAPDALPFTRGAFFLSTSLDTLFKRNRNTLGDVLKCSVDLMKELKDPIIQDLPVYDVSSLEDEIPEAGVLSLNYVQSSVKVCGTLY